MLITDAKPDDIPALAELLGMLFTQESEFKPDPARQSEGLRLIIGNPELGKILVARDGGAILGMVNLLFSVSTALGGPVAVVEDVVVRPESRGNGVGTALLKTALEFSDSRGFLRLMLNTDPDNHRAIQLYQGLGFTRSHMLTFRRMPPTPRAPALGIIAGERPH